MRDDFTFIFPEGAVRRRDMTREQLERVVDWMISDRQERMNRELIECSDHPKMTAKLWKVALKNIKSMVI
jgi:hypothetical protein